MSGKAVSAIMMFLVVLGTLALAFNIQPVKCDYTWTETIYIMADGSVHPSTAPISSVDNVTYTLTENILGNVTDYSSAVNIERDNIIIDGEGHTLQGTLLGTLQSIQVAYSKGIELTGRSNITIKNMKITAFDYGIYLSSSSNSISVSGNNITNNWEGIMSYPKVLSYEERPYSSSYTSVSANNITNNGVGIWLRASSSDSVSGNNITNNDGGITLEYTDDSIITNNNFTNDGAAGIDIESSSNNTVSGNNITNNDIGIKLGGSYNSACGNDITNNGYAIFLLFASYNSMSGNDMTNNFKGIELTWSSNNMVYHNNFTNSFQVFSFASTNVWDDGYPSGGNYWSDYTGVDVKSGPGQDLPGSDGVGDTQYNPRPSLTVGVDGNPINDPSNRDRYPLMYPYGTPLPPTYALTITTTVGGATDPTPGTYSYTVDSAVPVTAIPNAHYFLDHWELDGSNVGSAVSYAVSMGCNHTLTAVLVLAPPLLVSTSPYSASVHLLQSVTFTSITVGGAPPYSYQWYLNDSPVSGATSSNWTFALKPSGNYSTGTYIVHLNVTDGIGDNSISSQVNVTVLSLLGDLNNDGKVDIKDVSAVGGAFGSSPNGPRWNPQADVNQDGKVDIKDIALVAKHFGQHYP